MKGLGFIFVTTSLISQSLMASSAALLGEWRVHSLWLNGVEMPRPDPDLEIRWSFYPHGTSRLFWGRAGEGFCERFAHYELAAGLLIEQVFALNPRNAKDCAADPDMQMDRKTKTPIEVLPDELRLHVPLSDQTLVYVLRPVELISLPEARAK